ncbi:hypothetical protein J3P85_03985 [Pseudomonas sp. Z1-12]|uniref:hypothetical protein n=1 Tax=Pseudomonas sp. Z1-12 TaxID=2817408 RepID=UPI003DA83666
MSSQPQYESIITAREVGVVREYISLSTRLRAKYDNMKGSTSFTTLSSQCGLSTALDEQGVETLINAVLSHAGRWSGIEASMRALCAEVFEYSDYFTTASAAILEQIQSLPGYDSSSAQLQGVPEEAWEGVSIPLGEADLTIIPSIKMAIDEMSEKINSLKVTGGYLRDDIVSFKVELMNSIQTAFRRITQLDTIHELEEQLSRMAMDENDRLIVRGHMHNVTSAFAEVVEQSYIRENKVPSMGLINYYKDDYDRILQGLPSTSADILETLMLKMRSGAVLTQHFSAFHDAVERLDWPLANADKGVGQLRTLWTVTLEVMQSAQSRVLQVTSFAPIKRIEKSLDSAAAQWRSARSNAEELDSILATPY